MFCLHRPQKSRNNQGALVFLFLNAALLSLKKQQGLVITSFEKLWPNGNILLQNNTEDTSAQATPSDAAERNSYPGIAVA